MDLDEGGVPAPRQYANYAEVGYNAFEFLIDFAQHYPGMPAMQAAARIVTSPAYAKCFLEVLGRSVDDYEKCFGTIQQPPADERTGT
jgi:hypothetical protein